ncbi:MAG: DNA helicase II, partial [Proteobacteria bacterium]|nr:DNA helicase II [Pseudomonadota bacterium]
PHPRTLDDSGTAGLEEERRLAYVGLTRARRNAFISFAANRRIHGQWQSAAPSRFIDELPAEHVDIRSQPGLYGGGGTTGAGLGLSDNPAVFNTAGRPSWGRRRRRPQGQQRGGGIIEDVSFQALPKEDNDGGFKVGERVFHQKFGYGQIVAIDGPKLEIAFEKAGGKKVMASFVEAV